MEIRETAVKICVIISIAAAWTNAYKSPLCKRRFKRGEKRKKKKDQPETRPRWLIIGTRVACLFPAFSDRDAIFSRQRSWKKKERKKRVRLVPWRKALCGSFKGDALTASRDGKKCFPAQSDATNKSQAFSPLSSLFVRRNFPIKGVRDAFVKRNSASSHPRSKLHRWKFAKPADKHRQLILWVSFQRRKWYFTLLIRLMDEQVVVVVVNWKYELGEHKRCASVIYYYCYLLLTRLILYQVENREKGRVFVFWQGYLVFWTICDFLSNYFYM